MNSTDKRLAGTLLLAMLMTTSGQTLLAADEHAGHHPATDTPAADAVPTATNSPAMANMNKMREQMAAIRAAKDPKERAKLLDEHMQTMQATTQIMQQDKSCMMMSGMGMKGSETNGGMSMMQMMMEQMMQHQKALQTNGK